MYDFVIYLVIAVEVIIFIYFLFLNGSYTILTFLSLINIRGQLAVASSQYIDELSTGVFYRPISVLVPAFNEEKTIISSVSNLLTLNFPEYEIVVINDGSTDDTLSLMIAKFDMMEIERPLSLKLHHEPIRAQYVSLSHPNLFLIDKENGGKSDALNVGINASRYPLFCSMDADSLLESDALLRASKLFVEDREVIATGGIIRVLNGCTVENGKITSVRAPKRALECFQSVEYIRGFLTGRTSWNAFNSLLIISGAFGIFRKDMIQAIGGYRKSVGEDMDLVVRLHRHCNKEKIRYKILFVPDPVCWTQVPSDYRSLLKQRNRWHRGLIDSLRFSRGMSLNPRYGKVGLVGVPYFLLVEAFGPTIEFAGYFSFVFFFFFGYISRDFALLFLLLSVLWGTWLNIGSILLDNLIYRRYHSVWDLLKLSFFGLIEFIGYRQLIVVERLIATFTFWKTEWGKAHRQEIKDDIPQEAN
ncbi:glycosyltransferase family 2 protein [Geobacter hydrogenophilus]|uniref:Glycosyl transferase n=1 Tax=Geobacter hydrogenophilus TaxID=40983 RepID=A0A9W6G2J8_9BACT|nr:glycosyltransferase family 2 protein [Geobacter hydrogenophilus]MBT0892966.1 glycosyltransferase family 2 protein [Geobacter hydrogenophilus]GLI39198.1 glycosyl transferase [Geobacter hydrogenophilus]